MTAATQGARIADRLSAAGSYVANVIRGGKPPPEKRMSSTYVLNLVSGTALVMIVLINLVISSWRIGLNTQEVKCLPGTVYLVRQSPPDTVAVGQLIAYRSLGLQPYLKDGTTVAKLVAGVPGDQVTVDRSGISVNGKHWGPLNDVVMRKTAHSVDGLTRTFTVAPDELLVLGTLPRSYDGRYWGTIKRDQLIGNAWRLW